jgi:phage terminase large subunit-like protein
MILPEGIDPEKLLKLLRVELEKRKSERKLAEYSPYSKQRDFHNSSAQFRERLLMAGNQLGKTLSAGMETAAHVTGLYPDWWQGRRFEKAPIGWVAGVTGESTRDNPQRILLGRPGEHGTGSIPKDRILNIVSSRGTPDAVDSVTVKHESGGVSHIGFKSYEKGREKWQGETLDFVWFDEEPPIDIYTEGLTRTNATGGIVYVTFTPLLGMSDVVKRYLIDKRPGTNVTSMTIDDVEHYTPEQRQAIINSYQEWERDARIRGVPQLGSGRVFPVSEEIIKVDPFQIPPHWGRIGGLDFGWGHPNAAIQIAWDRDSDTYYVISAHRQREVTPILFSSAVKSWGPIPFAWPHDGLQHDKGSGEQLAVQYRKAGLNMLRDRATFEDGTNGVEAGIALMLQTMQEGRFKVFSHLSDWFEEFRLYHRKDGLIVKLNDDLMSATRYAVMMRRFCKPLLTSNSARPLYALS